MPTSLVCVPITVEDPTAAIADAIRAKDAGANLVEFRVDSLYHAEDDIEGRDATLQLAADSPLPCIITCRPAYEGGAFEGDDAARVSLIEALCAAPTPPRYIDFEFLTYSRSPHLHARIDAAIRDSDDTGLILSTHDFEGRPPNLLNLLTQMRATSAGRIHKIAFRARSLRDNLELFDLLREMDRPTIALAMGEFGLPSRVLAQKFGAFLTFASLRDASATAPGQPTIRELLDTYRFRSITPRTRIYGLVGWPVSQSIGPHVHNAGFEAVEHDGVYLPLPIPSEWEHFKATILALLDATHLDFAGCSVTIPHKEHLLRLAREDTSRRWSIDDVAQRVGAANTLTLDPDGACLVTNTDVAGIAQPLRAHLEDLAGKRIAIIGAGGVARAAAVALTDAGAAAVVYARNPERAQALIDSIDPAGGKLVLGTWDKLAGSRCQAYVNCTPVGMASGPDPSGCVLPNETFDGCHADTVFFDTVYNPVDTALLRRARAQGATTISGLEMFVLQAAAQFQSWTASPAPTGLFMRVSQETLASPPPP